MDTRGRFCRHTDFYRAAGEGISVACGLALAGKREKSFDVFAMTGDGELQEGMPWEAFMYAGQQGLSNFCVLVDYNNGQLECVDRLIVPFNDLKGQIESFGWNVIETDANRMENVTQALDAFKYHTRDGRPVAILCKSHKGYGGFSSFTTKHKIKMNDIFYNNEIELQKKEYIKRIELFKQSFEKLSDNEKKMITERAKGLNFNVFDDTDLRLEKKEQVVKTRKADIRNKRIAYAKEEIARINIDENTSPDKVITAAMKVLARDERIVSVDSDLNSISGLQAGVAYIDKTRAINVGIAEANMMNIGEAFALLGHNVWVSTFCPFFNWQVMRRIAIGYQERIETIEKNRWVAERRPWTGYYFCCNGAPIWIRQPMGQLIWERTISSSSAVFRV